jgi:hypothetical protein
MLGNVISRLAERRKRTWLPFRNSKLTRLLQSTLGGNARAVFIATIHPSVDHAEETASTLRFAARAMQVENTVSVNERGLEKGELLRGLGRDVDKLLGPLQDRKISELQRRFAALQGQVRCLSDNQQMLADGWDCVC